MNTIYKIIIIVFCLITVQKTLAEYDEFGRWIPIIKEIYAFNNVRDINSLKGPIKSISFNKYLLTETNDTIRNTARRPSKIIMNRNGFLLSQIIYNQDGTIFYKDTILRNEKDQPLSIILLDSAGINSRIDYKYSNDKLITTYWFTNDTLKKSIHFKYDTNGYLTKEYRTRPNVKRELINNIYVNDQQGNCTKKIEYLKSKYNKEWRYIFNNDGRCIEETVLTEGVWEGHWKYTTNEDGRLTEQIILDESSKIIGKRVNEYKKDLIEKSIWFDKDGNLTEIKIYTCDHLKNVTSAEYFDSTNKLQKKEELQYQYDAWGNIIKRTFLKNDVPKELTIREIEYY